MTRARLPGLHEVQAASRDPRLLRTRNANHEDPTWRSQARCRTVDPETFFPLPTEPADMALALCRVCDVQAQCLAAALNAGDVDGVWGATTQRERRAMLVARRNSGGTVAAPAVPAPPSPPLGRKPAVDRRPVPVEPAPDLCAGRHEQNTTTRGIRSDGRPYCRACAAEGGAKGGASTRAQWAAGRPSRQQVAS